MFLLKFENLFIFYVNVLKERKLCTKNKNFTTKKESFFQKYLIISVYFNFFIHIYFNLFRT